MSSRSERGGIDPGELGERVRRVRLARGLTLKQIESTEKVSATHVSEIERGRTSPTVGALARVAKALDVDLVSLLDPGEPLRLHVSRAAGRERILMCDGYLELEPLSAGSAAAEMSLFLARLGARASVQPRPGRERGEDIVAVQEGSVVVASGDQVETLSATDVLHLRSLTPVEFRNPGDEPASFVWISWPGLAL